MPYEQHQEHATAAFGTYNDVAGAQNNTHNVYGSINHQNETTFTSGHSTNSGILSGLTGNGNSVTNYGNSTSMTSYSSIDKSSHDTNNNSLVNLSNISLVGSSAPATPSQVPPKLAPATRPGSPPSSAAVPPLVEDTPSPVSDHSEPDDIYPSSSYISHHTTTFEHGGAVRSYGTPPQPPSRTDIPAYSSRFLRGSPPTNLADAFERLNRSIEQLSAKICDGFDSGSLRHKLSDSVLTRQPDLLGFHTGNVLPLPFGRDIMAVDVFHGSVGTLFNNFLLEHVFRQISEPRGDVRSLAEGLMRDFLSRVCDLFVSLLRPFAGAATIIPNLVIVVGQDVSETMSLAIGLINGLVYTYGRGCWEVYAVGGQDRTRCGRSLPRAPDLQAHGWRSH